MHWSTAQQLWPDQPIVINGQWNQSQLLITLLYILYVTNICTSLNSQNVTLQIRTETLVGRRAECKLSDWTYTVVKLPSIFCMDIGLTLSLLMSYVCGAPCKSRNFNVVYIWTYVWQRWKPPLSICCTMFQHWINAKSYPVAQLCVNTLLATKVTLITDGI
jgi:hypothetical protein